MGLKSHGRKTRSHRTADPYVIVPRRMKKGEKQMLAEYLKALPMTADRKNAKLFLSRTGALNFIRKHATLRKRMRSVKASTVAA